MSLLQIPHCMCSDCYTIISWTKFGILSSGAFLIKGSCDCGEWRTSTAVLDATLVAHGDEHENAFDKSENTGPI